ncbi:MAG: hypothetical protein COB15_11090 [Flavobacteriales bacterium]|nr:MAG: hypothetical protein COB15_11090 [Flavobacteriales bacterium]
MKIFRAIIAFFQALLPLLGFGVISIVIYAGLPKPYNILVSVTLFIIGIYASRSIFNMMMRRGVLSVMSADNATFDLDELEPTEGDGVLKLTPEELRRKFLKDKLELGKCTVSIYGDWEGRQLNIKHQLKSIEFNSKNNSLTLLFSDNCLLRIRNPRLIFSTSSYLKIVKATEILWQIPDDFKAHHQFSYLNTGEKIKTKSNTDWKPHDYDIGIGMNAIYLQG